MVRFHFVSEQVAATPDGQQKKLSARVAIEAITGKDDDTEFVTPPCVTFEELDSWLQKIEASVREVRQEARKTFGSEE